MVAGGSVKKVTIKNLAFIQFMFGVLAVSKEIDDLFEKIHLLDDAATYLTMSAATNTIRKLAGVVQRLNNPETQEDALEELNLLVEDLERAEKSYAGLYLAQQARMNDDEADH